MQYGSGQGMCNEFGQRTETADAVRTEDTNFLSAPSLMKTLFMEIIPKKGLLDLCGRNFVGRSRTKTFRASLGKFGQKSYATPKICLFLHLASSA